MSLRTRLVLAAAYLLIVVVVVLEVPLARTLKRRVEQDFANSIVTLSSIVASQVNDDIGCIDQAAITPSEPCTLEDPWTFISTTIQSAGADAAAKNGGGFGSPWRHVHTSPSSTAQHRNKGSVLGSACR